VYLFLIASLVTAVERRRLILLLVPRVLERVGVEVLLLSGGRRQVQSISEKRRGGDEGKEEEDKG
jgi:hypothetical protein